MVGKSRLGNEQATELCPNSTFSYSICRLLTLAVWSLIRWLTFC